MLKDKPSPVLTDPEETPERPAEKPQLERVPTEERSIMSAIEKMQRELQQLRRLRNFGSSKEESD